MAEDIGPGGVIGPSGRRARTGAVHIEPEPAADRARFADRAAAERRRLGLSGAVRMPAEWEPHAATWIAWPHHEPDWPGKLGPIPWVYAEIVRVLHDYERVEILCHSEEVREGAIEVLRAHGVSPERIRPHVVPNDRVWLRDSAPTGVVDAEGRAALANWRFNAWAKYDNYAWSRSARTPGSGWSSREARSRPTGRGCSW
jgi:agmatine/peptidylarginine deiminase